MIKPFEDIDPSGGLFGGGYVDPGDSITYGLSGEGVFRSLGIIPRWSSDGARAALNQRIAQRGFRNSLLSSSGDTLKPGRVPTSTKASTTARITSTLASVPTWAWVLLLVLLFVPGGHRRRH